MTNEKERIQKIDAVFQSRDCYLIVIMEKTIIKKKHKLTEYWKFYRIKKLIRISYWSNE